MKQKQYMKSGYNDIIRQRKKSIEKNKTKKPEKKVFKTNASSRNDGRMHRTKI